MEITIKKLENKVWTLTNTEDGKEYGFVDLRKAITAVVKAFTGEDVDLKWRVKN